MMKLKDIQQAHIACVGVLVKEIIQRLHLHSYEDVWEYDVAIERLTRQRTSLMPTYIAEVVDLMVMDALYLYFKEI